MRFSLRLLLVVLAITPPLLAWGFQFLPTPEPRFWLEEDEELSNMKMIWFESWEEYEEWNSDPSPEFREFRRGVVAMVRQRP